MSVPSNTLLFRREGMQVAMVRDGRVHLQPVTIGKDNGRSVEIATGVSPNDEIILDPSDSIAEGEPVNVNPHEQPAQQPGQRPPSSQAGRCPDEDKARGLCSLSVASLLLLSGCMVGPKYHQPTPPTAPSFKEATPVMFKETPDWQLAKPEDAIPRGDWWTLFHDPGLNRSSRRSSRPTRPCGRPTPISGGPRQHPRAERRPLSHCGYCAAARRRALLRQPPLLQRGRSQQRPGRSASCPCRSTTRSTSGDAFAATSPPPREDSQATAADRQTVLLTLQAELAMDYFELRAADAKQKLLNDTVAQYEDALRVTTNRFTGGIAVKSDVTQAQTQLQAAKVQAADVAIQRAQYEHAIASSDRQSAVRIVVSRPHPFRSTPSPRRSPRPSRSTAGAPARYRRRGAPHRRRQ